MAASWCCHYRQRLLLRLWTFLRTDAIPSIPIKTATDSYNLDLYNKNIVVDIDDLERDMAISNGKGSLRHWCLGYGQCFSVISISWYNSLIQQHKQAYLFLSYFWSSAIIQTPIWLGRSSKNIYIDEPKSRNHIAIDSLSKSLTFRTKCRNHRIIKKINK